MRITIDGRFLGPRLTGLGRYVAKIAEELQQIDDRNRYTVLLGSKNWDDFLPERRNFETALADVPWYSVAEQVRMPRIVSRTRPDLVHFPNFNIPLAYRGPFIVTIHDLIKDQFGPSAAAASQSRGTRLKYHVYRRIVRAAAHRARLVLVPSEAVRSGLIEMFDVSYDKVVVTPEAADHVFTSDTAEPNQEDVLARYGIREPYVLYVGNAYPYKNLESVIDALAEIPPPLFLVNPCSRDVFYPRLRQRAAERSVADRLILPGFVPDRDLAVVYRRARAYVFPSLAEGFGIPALEAMASGVPVACSDIPVMREVCADAAVYFSPNDPADIAGSLMRLNSDQLVRSDLVGRGRRRAEEFSWRRTAELTLDAYLRAVPEAGAERR